MVSAEAFWIQAYLAISVAFTINITYGAVISVLYMGHLALMIHSEWTPRKK